MRAMRSVLISDAVDTVSACEDMDFKPDVG
jgi:hypothetical protein